jgi:hypothetical protein
MGNFGIFIPKFYRNLSKIRKSSTSLLFAWGMGSATSLFPERNKALEGACRRLEILLSYETLSSFSELYQEKKKDFNLTSTGSTYQSRD